jgi:uncharacterized membrane protein YgcG
MNPNASTSSGIDFGPIITVAVILFIVMCLIWAIPITLNILQTRPTRTFNNIDRADRTEAAIFCYSLSKEQVQQIKSLLTLDEKKEALQAEYLKLNPQESPAQAAIVIKAYLEIYGTEVGMADSVLRSRAAMPTGAHDAHGNFIPFDFSDSAFDSGASSDSGSGGGDSGGGDGGGGGGD